MDSGILLPITSLPSNCGVGTLAEAPKFIKFLKASKQSYWQILPVTPTDFVNSPYSSPSAFAGNTLLIDLDNLVSRGLLSEETLSCCRTCRGNDYDFAKLHNEIALRESYKQFVRYNLPSDYLDFCQQNAFWLNDYSLFCALKKHFGGKSWQEWDDDIRLHDSDAVSRYTANLSDEIDFVKFCQYIFFSQWKSFRKLLKQNDIKLIGDIPIYVSYDSSDVWANPKLFELTADRRPSFVAGVPPDYFSADGQLWGNPLYNWDVMKKSGYAWWKARVKKCEELFDVLRIDHFRAFDSYYAIRYGEKTAKHGMWKRGVGFDFISQLKSAVPNLTIVAEDLGDIPQSVIELRDKCGLAGMKVVQFAFDGNPQNAFLPQNFNEHCIAYLGTHDNDTTTHWYKTLDEKTQALVLKMLNLPNDQDISRQIITKVACSKAELVIYTMQDIVGSSERINAPGTTNCWRYMAKQGDFSSANAKWLASVTIQSGRAKEDK